MNTRQQVLAIWRSTKRGYTDPTRAAKVADTNVRHARQLIGGLVQAGLFVEVEREGEARWIRGHDTDAASINRYLDTLPVEDAPLTETDTNMAATATAPKSTTRRNNSANAPHECRCGCGSMIPGKSNYKPGHDARHAGQVARAMSAVSSDSWESLLDTLPSEPLQRKALGMAERLVAKAEAKKSARREIKAEVEQVIEAERETWTSIDPVQVGRWTYPARKDADGNVERNTKRDGSGEWIEVDSK